MSKPLKVQIIEKARALVEDERHWCRGCSPRGALGATARADSFCLRSQHGFAGTRWADREDHLASFEVGTPSKLGDERRIECRQGAEVATILNNLARLYHDQERFADAEPLYKRSLAIVEKTLGSKNLKASTRVRNLADLYHAQGRDEEARPLYQRLAEMKSAAAR